MGLLVLWTDCLILIRVDTDNDRVLGLFTGLMITDNCIDCTSWIYSWVYLAHYPSNFPPLIFQPTTLSLYYHLSYNFVGLDNRLYNCCPLSLDILNSHIYCNCHSHRRAMLFGFREMPWMDSDERMGSYHRGLWEGRWNSI